jgi:hypothetical protein
MTLMVTGHVALCALFKESTMMCHPERRAWDLGGGPFF